MTKIQANHNTLIIRWLPKQEYHSCWLAMREFTDQRTASTPDEIWLCEHEPVFTQGQNGKAEHILAAGDIPVVQTDRGGQVTYHGPGQLMVYTLIDLRRKKFNVRQLVTLIEQSVIDFLASLDITAVAKSDAPGVYVDDKKIGSIGLRIRRGCSYHGIAFNVALDLSPFTRINPCGFKNLEMTQLSSLSPIHEVCVAGDKLSGYLEKNLGYDTASRGYR